jgi:hypothetical protein
VGYSTRKRVQTAMIPKYELCTTKSEFAHPSILSFSFYPIFNVIKSDESGAGIC